MIGRTAALLSCNSVVNFPVNKYHCGEWISCQFRCGIFGIGRRTVQDEHILVALPVAERLDLKTG